MATTAVFNVHDKDGLTYGPTRRLYTDWGSPEHQIVFLADFYTWTTQQHQPMTSASLLAYAAERPGFLPARPLTLDDTQPSRVDYRYRLTLSDNNHGLRLLVQPRPGLTGPPVPADINQGNLFVLAAAMCERLAERVQRYADSHDGFAIPGGEPRRWLDRAAGYRDRHQQLTAGDHANLTARHVTADFDAPYPGVQVAGAYVVAYVHRDGHLQVSVHLDETEPWLARGDGTVPLQITVEHTDVFTG
jgi:hypothetical protein